MLKLDLLLSSTIKNADVLLVFFSSCIPVYIIVEYSGTVDTFFFPQDYVSITVYYFFFLQRVPRIRGAFIPFC